MTETKPGQGWETRSAAKAAGEAKYWSTQIGLSDKDHKDWLEAGQKVVDKYRCGKKDVAGRSGKKSFNILFSNTEVLKGALFAKMAKPDVRRRYNDQDSTGRMLAEIVERSLIELDDSNDPLSQFEKVIEDYVLPGRGIIRVMYEAQLADAEPEIDPITGQPLPPKQYIAEQELYEQYWNWRDFRHDPVECWEQVTWIAFCHRMDRDTLHKNFDRSNTLSENDADPIKAVDSIPLDWEPDMGKK